jgi:hypothetical protein
MAPEPEKKIDESLRAYANKRREDAGAPLDLHPATRRMLQGEVAKLRAAQPAERRWWQVFFPAWPRFAAAAGMFAVLATGVWVFTQSETEQVNKAAEMAYTRQVSDYIETEDRTAGAERVELAKELDAMEPLSSKAEEGGKKLAKTPAGGFYDESKVQLRDAENAPGAPRPAMTVVQSEILREKQVAVQYDAPALQPATLDAVAVAGGDKLSVSKPNEDGSDRFYRMQDARAVKLEDSVAKNGLAVDAPTVITSGVTLAFPRQPVTANYFAYSDTNAVELFAKLKQQTHTFNFQTTNTSLGLPLRQPAVAGASTHATEWAAAPVLAAKESRARAIQPAAAFETAGVAQEFERRDGAAVPAVLQKFELQQHANGRISIRDADGSLYEGEILAAKMDFDANTEPAQTKDTFNEVNRRLARSEDKAFGSLSRGVSFRASGTNRNKQLVVINGQLLEEQEQLGRGVTALGKSATEPAPTSPVAATAPPASQPTADSQQRSSRTAASVEARGGARLNESLSAISPLGTNFNVIQGRVQIGRTNEVPLRAIRTR